jgi:hypothetical protein
MTQDDFALMAAVFAGALVVAAIFGWRGGNARADVALMGGLAAAFGSLAGLLFAS